MKEKPKLSVQMSGKKHNKTKNPKSFAVLTRIRGTVILHRLEVKSVEVNKHQDWISEWLCRAWPVKLPVVP